MRERVNVLAKTEREGEPKRAQFALEEGIMKKKKKAKKILETCYVSHCARECLEVRKRKVLKVVEEVDFSSEGFVELRSGWDTQGGCEGVFFLEVEEDVARQERL